MSFDKIMYLVNYHHIKLQIKSIFDYFFYSLQLEYEVRGASIFKAFNIYCQLPYRKLLQLAMLSVTDENAKFR